ncbi:MAG: hypothetical protein Q8O37_02590 [Sulfuricellaceae bacterium]|nr:hypothetical protein [Sulfuricellaceae bacterium]
MSDFKTDFNGTFYSLMSWAQLTEFWLRVDPGLGWHLYAIGEQLPALVSSSSEVSRFIEEIDAMLHREHDETYCGIVYADDLEHPRMIKIFDPNNLGSSCGSGKMPPPLPGWVMSVIPPAEMQPRGVIPANRKRWWQSLFS